MQNNIVRQSITTTSLIPVLVSPQLEDIFLREEVYIYIQLRDSNLHRVINIVFIIRSSEFGLMRRKGCYDTVLPSSTLSLYKHDIKRRTLVQCSFNASEAEQEVN